MEVREEPCGGGGHLVQGADGHTPQGAEHLPPYQGVAGVAGVQLEGTEEGALGR